MKIKFFLLASTLMLTFGCQKEEFNVIEEEALVSLSQDTELKELVKGVSSHDGSFDDRIDNSSCMSVNFPYRINLNGSEVTISSIADLSGISEDDVATLIFPATITFATYETVQLENESQLTTLQQLCNSGELFNERITCIDFIYPLKVSVYDTENNSFKTILFNHDKDTFTHIISFTSTERAQLKYPVQVALFNGITINITSNDQLKSEILQAVPLCE